MKFRSVKYFNYQCITTEKMTYTDEEKRLGIFLSILQILRAGLINDSYSIKFLSRSKSKEMVRYGCHPSGYYNCK